MSMTMTMTMTMTLSAVQPKNHLKLFSPKFHPRIYDLRSSSFSLNPSSLTIDAMALNKLQCAHNVWGPLNKTFCGVPVNSGAIAVRALNESGISDDGVKEETEARGVSSMPERFRYLYKEAPDKPVRWPWVVVLAFMLYAWRFVLWELSNWSKAAWAIVRFLLYISKFALALIFHFVGDPITSFIWTLETSFYKIRSIYSAIIAYAPIQDLTLIIILVSSVLAVAEATVPDSVNIQPYLLTVAGLIGFAAVANYISELFFWTLLVGLFAFAKLVKKRDYVSSSLPSVAVLVAVGEPWVRAIAMAAYLALAIFHRYNNPVDLRKDEEARGINRVPFPLLCAAFAIGIRLAANWAGYRHLTWMVA